MMEAASAEAAVTGGTVEATTTKETVQDKPSFPTIQLLGRRVTLEEALEDDSNIINEAAYLPATKRLYDRLWKERSTMEALVKHHLNLDRQATCAISEAQEWIRGSFNVCIPIDVQSCGKSQKLMLRCAMPHKLAEARYPGTVDEKVSCEVGAYVWVQEKCPEIHTPQLYGFSLSDHRTFTHEASRSFCVRILQRIRHLLYRLFRPSTVLSHYTLHKTPYRLPTAYLLLEHVGSDNSQMLSVTFDKHRDDQERRQQLYRGIARVMLSLARVPQPRIGSFRFHDNGTISLTNRPLQCFTVIAENDGTPRTIQKNDMYTCTDHFATDMFAFHDERFLSHPNAIVDAEGCRELMAGRVLLRSLAHRYIRRDRRHGPFALQLDDFHASNIFVDKNWKITALVDLEWICALPVESLDVPFWLAGRDIDGYSRLHADYKEYAAVQEEFMAIFEREERSLAVKHSGPLLSQIMREGWASDSMWFWYCLKSINAMNVLFLQHICPKFKSYLRRDEEKVISTFWSERADDVVEDKVKAYSKYETGVKDLFTRNAFKDGQRSK